MAIHPTAIVGPQARIDPSAEIGPYVVIDGEVSIGPRCCIGPHVYITGNTTIGADNRIHACAVIGDLPQDMAFKNARTYVRIGDGNIIREGVTIHRGTAPESATVVGNRCFLMANSHIAHNCQVADGVKLANGVLLAGHVHVGAEAFLSGNVVVHQFVRIGRLCMLSGAARVVMDVPHFMMAHGDNTIIGINRVGLQRAGFSSQQIMDIRAVYRRLFRSGTAFSKVVDELIKENHSGPVGELIDFVRAPSKRGIAGPPSEKRFRENHVHEKE